MVDSSKVPKDLIAGYRLHVSIPVTLIPLQRKVLIVLKKYGT